MNFTTVFILIQIFIIGSWTQDCQPFGLRLNFGTNFAISKQSEKIGVRFDTRDSCIKSYLVYQKYGTDIHKLYCDSTQIKIDTYSSYVHHCSIEDLNEGEEIKYMVTGWTGKTEDPQFPYQNDRISYYFPKNSDDFKMVSLADWGYMRSLQTKYKPLTQSLSYLLRNQKDIRAIYINGDIAYDLDSDNGERYDDFVRMISQVTPYWPIIITPGNHEHNTNCSQVFVRAFQTYQIFKEKAVMLKLPKFSFVLFDTYQILYNNVNEKEQAKAFKKLLMSAAQSKQVIIPASHYPFKCNGEPKDCEKKYEKTKSFYSAMFQANVPLYLGAHHHVYERHYPFKADQTFDYIEGPYIWNEASNSDQRRLVTIVQGVAGNDQGLIQDFTPTNNFTVSHLNNQTGYGILIVTDSNIQYSHYVSDEPIRPFDSFQIVLERTGKKHLRKTNVQIQSEV